MSKNNLSLEKIFNKLYVKFRESDIPKFTNNKDVEQIIKFAQKQNRDIADVLMENEEEIDVEKLLLVTYIRVEEAISELQNDIKKGILTDLERKIADKKIKEYKKDLEIIKEFTKGKDIYLVTVVRDGDKIENIEVDSSKEIIEKVNLDKKEKRNKELFEEINKKYLEQEDDDIGFNYIIQCLETSDFLELLPRDIASAASYKIENNILKICEEQVKRIVEKANLNEENDEEMEKLYKHIREYGYIPEMARCIQELYKYIEIEQVVVAAIYGSERVLDLTKQNEEEITIEEMAFIKRIAEDALSYIKKGTKISKDGKSYGYRDIEDLIDRINEEDGKYATKVEMEELRYLVLNGYDLGKLSPEDTYKLGMLKLTDNEVRKVMKTSKDNLAFGVMKLNPPEKEIIKIAKENKGNWSEELTCYLLEYNMISISSLLELFYIDVVNKEFCKEFFEENDLSSEINLQKINEQYLLVKGQKEQNQENVSKLDKMIELYKLVNIEEKRSEELEDISDSVMYEIAENFEDEDDILFYYEKGLVTLRTVAEWSGESTIERLYNEEKITFEDIENANIGIDIKKAVLGKHIMANVESYSQDELLEYINKAYLTEKNIYDIYKIALLNETYAEDMLYNGIISAPTYNQITNIGKEVLEEQADTRFSNLLAMGLRNFSLNLMEDEMEESDIAIGDVPVSKKQNEQLDEEGKGKSSKYPISTKSTESLIDPNIRWEFLKALKCKLPKDKEINNQDPNNPFYNYEFYVIESDNDEVEKDSIVIAERFFKDKYIEEEYATSNATYIWQYKDYLIAQRMLKSEQKKNKKAVLQETEGIVYVANHRPGSWAVSLLYKIAQAKAGKSFEEYKRTDKGANKVLEQLEKLYTQEELIKILDLAKIIDDDQKVMMPNGKEAGLVYDVIKEDRRIEARKNESHGDSDGR